MSKFSYISFPRPADTTILKDDRQLLQNGFSIIKNEALENYRIGEFQWDIDTACIQYKPISIECEWNAKVLDKMDFVLGLAVVDERNGALFTNCFKNKYIYEFGGSLNYSGGSDLLKDTSEFAVRLLNTTIMSPIT